MPCLRANPATACGGAAFGGPSTRSTASGCRAGRPSARSTRRRGVASRRTESWGISSFSKDMRRFSSAVEIIQSGISSVPISSRNGRLTWPPTSLRWGCANSSTVSVKVSGVESGISTSATVTVSGASTTGLFTVSGRLTGRPPLGRLTGELCSPGPIDNRSGPRGYPCQPAPQRYGCGDSLGGLHGLLVAPGGGDGDGHLAYPLDHADAFGDADGAPRIQRIKEVRALKHLIIGRKQRKALLFQRLRVVELEQAGGLALVQVEELPEGADVRYLEVVDGVLQLVVVTHVTVTESGRPLDIVDAVLHLQEGSETFQPVGQLGRDQVQVDAATLLKIGELRDFQAVEHDLPADPPGAQGGGLPVVFFQLEIVLLEVDADGFQAAEVLLDHVGGGGLEDHLKLRMLVEPIRVIAVAPVGGAARGLHVGHTIWLGSEDAKEGLRAHGAGADLGIVGFLNDAAPVSPIPLQGMDNLLKRLHLICQTFQHRNGHQAPFRVGLHLLHQEAAQIRRRRLRPVGLADLSHRPAQNLPGDFPGFPAQFPATSRAQCAPAVAAHQSFSVRARYS